MTSRPIIRLSKSCIGDTEKHAVMGVLSREFLGMGAEVQEFEVELKKFFGRSAVCVANGTSALQLALQGCGIGTGDEVLVQSLTYVASFQAISATGATPVPCEIDPHSLTLNLEDAALKLTSKTKAIMPVHYAGCVGALSEIYEFAQKNNLRVIEDAAHAMGTIHQDRRVGGFGDIACFSFDGIKNITSGEGGCIVSDDEFVLEKIRDARLLGVKKDTDNRYSGGRSWSFEVEEQGWRYHMSNIMAAIGIEQLKRLPNFISIRQNLSKKYDEFLAECDQVSLLHKDYNLVAPHIYVILLKSNKINRDDLRKILLDRGIQTGMHYQPNHLLKFYKKKCDYSLPVTEEVFESILSLPLHADMSENDVAYICDQLKDVLNA